MAVPPADRTRERKENTRTTPTGVDNVTRNYSGGGTRRRRMRSAHTFPATPFAGVPCCGLAATLVSSVAESCGGEVGGVFGVVSCGGDMGGIFDWESFCGGEVEVVFGRVSLG